MSGLALALLIVLALLGAAEWERRGGRVPVIPEPELPAHGLTAFAIGLAMSVMFITIMAVGLALIGVMAD